MHESSVCFDECAKNRSICCDSADPHFICFDCLTTYAKTQIGDSKCDMRCAAACGSSYSDPQLRLIPDGKLFDKLCRLRQDRDIREACLEDMAECPFCDYKAICEPVEVNFEFRCANPDCERVSCRKCNKDTHIPLSCAEYAKAISKDSALVQRHKIEEAMTEALVRSCKYVTIICACGKDC